MKKHRQPEQKSQPKMKSSAPVQLAVDQFKVDQKMIFLAMKGDIKKMKALFDGNPKPNPLAKSKMELHTGVPALSLACLYGHENVVKFFVKEQKLEVNVAYKTTDDMLQSPLFAALSRKQIGVVRYLTKQANADPNLCADKTAALFLAIVARSFESVKLLKEAGARLDVKTSEGDTLLEYVEQIKSQDTMSLSVVERVKFNSKQEQYDVKKGILELRENIDALTKINDYLLQYPAELPEQKMPDVSEMRLRVIENLFKEACVQLRDQKYEKAVPLLSQWQQEITSLQSLPQSDKKITVFLDEQKPQLKLINAFRLNALIKSNKMDEAKRLCLETLKQLQERAVHDLSEEMPYLETLLHWPDQHEHLMARSEVLIASNQLGPYPLTFIHYLRGYIHFYAKAYDQADTELHEANQLASQLSNTEEARIIQQTILRGLGNVYFSKNEFQTALGFFERAVALNRFILKKSEKAKASVEAYQIAYLNAADYNVDYLTPEAGVAEIEGILAAEKSSPLEEEEEEEEEEEVSAPTATQGAQAPEEAKKSKNLAPIQAVHELDSDTTKFSKVTSKNRRAHRGQEKSKASSTTTGQLMKKMAPQSVASSRPAPQPKPKPSASLVVEVKEIKVTDLPTLLQAIENSQVKIDDVSHSLKEKAILTTIYEAIKRLHQKDKSHDAAKISAIAALKTIMGSHKVFSSLKRANEVMIQSSADALTTLFQELFPEWKDMVKERKTFWEELEKLSKEVWRKDRCYDVAFLFLKTYIQAISHPSYSLSLNKVMETASASVFQQLLSSDEWVQLKEGVRTYLRTLPIPAKLKPSQPNKKNNRGRKANTAVFYPAPAPLTSVGTIVEVVEPTNEVEATIKNAANQMGWEVIRPVPG